MTVTLIKLLFCYNNSNTLIAIRYCNNPMYWDRQTFANSAEPDQIPQNVASDKGLH